MTFKEQKYEKVRDQKIFKMQVIILYCYTQKFLLPLQQPKSSPIEPQIAQNDLKNTIKS